MCVLVVVLVQLAAQVLTIPLGSPSHTALEDLGKAFKDIKALREDSVYVRSRPLGPAFPVTPRFC